MFRPSQAAACGSGVALLDQAFLCEGRKLQASEAFFRSRLSSSRLCLRSSAGSVVKGGHFGPTGGLTTDDPVMAHLFAPACVRALRSVCREYGNQWALPQNRLLTGLHWSLSWIHDGSSTTGPRLDHEHGALHGDVAGAVQGYLVRILAKTLSLRFCKPQPDP
jgi:hypothetical protein